MEYREFRELPAWAPMKDVDLYPEIFPGLLKWSNAAPPPAIGAEVKLNFNNLGAGIVEAYFAQDGYLGVKVKLANPPAWYVEQNKGNVAGHAFGAEIG